MGKTVVGEREGGEGGEREEVRGGGRGGGGRGRGGVKGDGGTNA